MYAARALTSACFVRRPTRRRERQFVLALSSDVSRHTRSSVLGHAQKKGRRAGGKFTGRKTLLKFGGGLGAQVTRTSLSDRATLSRERDAPVMRRHAAPLNPRYTRRRSPIGEEGWRVPLAALLRDCTCRWHVEHYSWLWCGASTPNERRASVASHYSEPPARRRSATAPEGRHSPCRPSLVYGAL